MPEQTQRRIGDEGKENTNIISGISSRLTSFVSASPRRTTSSRANLRSRSGSRFGKKQPSRRRVVTIQAVTKAPPKKLVKAPQRPKQPITLSNLERLKKAQELNRKQTRTKQKPIVKPRKTVFKSEGRKKIKIDFGSKAGRLKTSDFKAGDTVSIKTRKGGTKTFRLESKDGSKTLRFAISGKDFKSKSDPSIPTTRISKTKKPKRSFGRKVGRNLTPKTPRRVGARPRDDFGSDFNIFQVTETRKPKPTARTNLGRGQLEKSSRLPLNQRSGELKREQGTDFNVDTELFNFGKTLSKVPAFVPRELAKPNSPLRQALAFTPIGQAGTFVSERVSNKPLAKKDRLIGSDFDVLNFFS